MAQLRTRTKTVEPTKAKSAVTKKTASVTKKTASVSKKSAASKPSKSTKQTFAAKDDDIETVVEYPTSVKERENFKNKNTGRVITAMQFRVYDLVRQIPAGHVTSYKVISDTLKSSPRAVGQALRVNPFCPLPIPCHRVIASDYTIGGFSGGSGDHQLTADKKAKLEKEGCVFKENYNYKSNVDGSTKFYSDFSL